MKKIKISTIILAIILVTMVAFFGIYVPKQNRMEDKVKGYTYAMDLKGARNITLKIDESKKTKIKDSEGKEVEDSENLTDEQIIQNGYTKEEIPYNAEDVLNEDNYKKSKNIIEKRLKELKIEDYNVKVDRNKGNIIIQIPEDDSTDTVVSNLPAAGKFEIIDSQTKEVLMNNDDIKLANVMYGSNSSSTTSEGTTVYLNIEFTKDGAKKLEDISNVYVKSNTTEENTEETNNQEVENKEKQITMMIDEQEIMSTSFEETIKTGKLQLSVGASSKDTDTLQGYISQATNMAVVLDTGKMPVKYTIDENKYILSDITNQELKMMEYIIAGITIIFLIICIIRYKMNGLLSAISYIGLASIFLLLIRYANVTLSIQGIMGIVIILILNYIFIEKLLSKLNKQELNKEIINKKMKETYKEFFITIVPIFIAVITFCFAGWTPISSFGMVMFWGITLMAIYNIVITNNLLKMKADK